MRSSAGHEPELAFSDGTNIHVMPSSRARVLDVGRRGARLMLEDGRAHVQVAHRPGADWQVQAGAFVIHVHGTAFFVEWNAAQSRFDLQMESGVVSVDGPRSVDAVVLRGGQSLSVRLDGARVVASTRPPLGVAASPRSGSETVPAPLPVEAPPPPESPAPVDTPRPAPSAAPQRARWSERLADGEAAGIVAEAQRRGVASVLAGASSEDLAALARRRPLPRPRPAGSACAARPAPPVPWDLAGRARRRSCWAGLPTAREVALRTRSPGTTVTCAKPLPERMPPRRWGG